MVLQILTKTKDDGLFTDTVLNLICYFTCRLIQVRPESVQKKFLDFFTLDKSSVNFFGNVEKISLPF